MLDRTRRLWEAEAGQCSRHHEAAAALHRTCRRNGETVRKLVDCIIAAQAIRAEVPVLHADADFDILARHTPLELA
jgi:predicted nucleic acid-binding protein